MISERRMECFSERLLIPEVGVEFDQFIVICASCGCGNRLLLDTKRGLQNLATCFLTLKHLIKFLCSLGAVERS